MGTNTNPDQPRVKAGLKGGEWMSVSAGLPAAAPLGGAGDGDRPAEEAAAARGVARGMIDDGRASVARMAEAVYAGLLAGRGIAAVDPRSDAAAVRAGDAAAIDARRNAALGNRDEPSSADLGEICYRAMAAAVDAAAGRGAYAPRRPGSAPRGLQPGTAEEAAMEAGASGPPTKGEVAQAKAELDRRGPMARPMYRGDWERRAGGRGPTVAEHREHLRSMADTNGPIRAARARYERLKAAYEASDKSQDAADETMSCGSCGSRYDPYEHGKCPECSYDG